MAKRRRARVDVGEFGREPFLKVGDRVRLTGVLDDPGGTIVAAHDDPRVWLVQPVAGSAVEEPVPWHEDELSIVAVLGDQDATTR